MDSTVVTAFPLLEALAVSGSPAYATATGTALLGHQPDAVIAAVAAKRIAFTPRTLVDPALRTQSATIRNGFATKLGECWGVGLRPGRADLRCDGRRAPSAARIRPVPARA